MNSKARMTVGLGSQGLSAVYFCTMQNLLVKISSSSISYVQT